MDPDPKEVPKVELEQLLSFQVRRTLFPSPQDFFERRDGQVRRSFRGKTKGFPCEGKPQATTYCAGGAGGSRTRTDITVQRILSPQRLPFRHRPAQRVGLGEG